MSPRTTATRRSLAIMMNIVGLVKLGIVRAVRLSVVEAHTIILSYFDSAQCDRIMATSNRLGSRPIGLLKVPFAPYFLLCFFLLSGLACQKQKSPNPPNPIEFDSISTALIDSLGELAYEDYASFEKQPDSFLKPIENKSLSPAQKDTYIWILINMAYGFQEHSRFLASTKYYEKALLYDNENKVLDLEDRLTYLYKPLANNYTILADYEKAEKLQLQAIFEAELPQTKASFYNNLALLYVFKGENEKSKDAALSGLQHSSENNYLNVLLHNSLSAAYIKLGNIDAAKRHNNMALHIANTLPMDQALASGKIATLERKAWFLLQDNQTDQTRKQLLEAISLEKTFFPQTRFREKANLYNALGESHLLHHEYAPAKEYFEQAKKLLNDNIASPNTSSYTKINILKNLGLVYAKQDVDTALYYFERAVEEDFAFQQNITSKESHLHGNMWNRRLLNDVFTALGTLKNLSQEKLTKLLWLTELTKGRLLWNDINRSATWEKDSTALTKAGQQLQQLYALRDNLTDSGEIAETNAQINTLLSDFELEEQYFTRKIPLPDFKTFQPHLKAQDAITYSFFIHADSSLSIFKIDNGKIAYFQKKPSGILDSIANFKGTYFSNSPHPFNAHPQKYFQSAQYLCQELLPDLPDVAVRLQLSLDNELHILPFDALSRGNTFLIEHFDVQYVHSLLIFDLYNTDTFQQQKISIFYRDKYDAPLADLHFVDKEVNHLRAHYQTHVYAYQDLNLKKFDAAFRKNTIIHIAAHTTVYGNQEAKLLLNQPISADQLRYYRIQAPLVVLSACNTASGNLLPSEGLESINRAFLSKGIPGVIATHWFANDDAMLDLTDKFYHYLATSKSPVHALAEAKRQYLAQQSEIGSNPWYWANMAYTGLETKIDLQRRTGLSFMLGILILLGLLSFMLFIRYKSRSAQSNQK